MKPSLIVVGSGFFGLTIAEHFARVVGKKVLVIEKRDHIGGNAFSEVDSVTGIEVHRYGTHLFHTSNDQVWQYINQFSKFNQYVHRVFSVHAKQIYSLPINLHTLSQLFGGVYSPKVAKELLQKERVLNADADGTGSFESRALSEIGPTLYNALIKGYTEKQWQTDPKLLPSEVFGRLPVRMNFDTRYFSDKYEGLPVDGYFSIFNRMTDNPLIEVELEKDYFESEWTSRRDVLTIYTGPLDRFYSFKYGALRWRTLDFEWERLALDDFQGNSVVNYADLEVPFTRIHEFKHLHPERSHKPGNTIISREYSREALADDDPYYPVNSELDREMLSKYRRIAKDENNIIFGGRLGRYQYLDMHMAIASAMKVFSNDILPRFKG